MEKEVSPYFFSGTSGLVLPIPKYRFPAPFESASRLTYYASQLNSIEINSSFYKIPLPATVAKWAGSVHPDFRFTFKLWREITHNKGLDFNEEDVTRFFHTIDRVESKKGSLLIQFPASITAEYRMQLEKLLYVIKKADRQGWDLAVEFRDRSWYNEAIYGLLHAFDAALVIHDMPASATPWLEHSSEFIYIRFHGPAGDYRGGYSEDFLNEYALYIHEWIKEKKKVYLYFNNTVGEAWDNLQTMNALLAEQNGSLSYKR